MLFDLVLIERAVNSSKIEDLIKWAILLDNSDEDLDGEILDDETKQIIGNVIDRDDDEIGFIGAKQYKFSQPTAIASKPFEPPQNLDQSLENNSEVTSEDEKGGFYNYFGNYGSRNRNDPFQDNSQTNNQNYYSYFSNDNVVGNMPGLGLFQTKRRTSRYDTYSYFPASQASKNVESPRRKFNNLNKTPFYTGSEDESGVFSESSISSKPFYNQRDADDDATPTKTFNLAVENNIYNFAQAFFPNIPQTTQNIQKQNPEPSYFEQESNDFGGFDESKLNYFFSDGVRFRNLKEGNVSEDPESSELPPGLH